MDGLNREELLLYSSRLKIMLENGVPFEFAHFMSLDLVYKSRTYKEERAMAFISAFKMFTTGSSCHEGKD